MASTTTADLSALAAWVFDCPINCEYCDVTEFGNECLHPRAGMSSCSCQWSILQQDGLGPCPEEEVLMSRMKEERQRG